ncbi:MAG TPA: peptidoglycan DD-metalloendopeptidase family protein [Gemmatimonadaceae bacterium]
MRRSGLAVLLTFVSATAAWGQNADARLRAQREQLDRIRSERDSLQNESRQLQGRVRSLQDEVILLGRQAAATTRLLKSLDQQLATVGAEVDTANKRVEAAQAEVVNRRERLRGRVRDIYKRGPLFATEAFLAARSFGELVARYKYLHELALYDQSVVKRVEDLLQQIDGQRQLLVRLQDEFERSREEKAREQIRLKDLEVQRQRALGQARKSSQQVDARLAEIRRDEARVANFIAAAEAAARRAAPGSADAAPATSALKTSDYGALDWPVDGSIIYSFGRAINPNNTSIRWNGIGIEAALGASVKAIADGEIMVAEPIGTYGTTVIIQHGGGDYSVYGSLQRAGVMKGAKVKKGQIIGTVGQADPDLAPHLHFEIRPKGRATDPLTWLQQRR